MTKAKTEDEICERTLRRLRKHAKVMNITLDKAFEDVIPDTMDRLTAYLARKAMCSRVSEEHCDMQKHITETKVVDP